MSANKVRTKRDKIVSDEPLKVVSSGMVCCTPLTMEPIVKDMKWLH